MTSRLKVQPVNRSGILRFARALLWLAFFSFPSILAATPAPGVGEVVKPQLEINADQLNKMIADQQPIVIDIRTPSEFAAGHIAGAININYFADDFRMELAKLRRDNQYVLHCKSGSRSSRALVTMRELGFAEVLHFASGFDGWQDAGFAVAR